MTKVLAAMSGGVDSSVAAYLALKDGFEVVGATMRLTNPGFDTGDVNKCGFGKDVEDAANVCATLGIPHEVKNYSADFHKCVIEHFIDTYLAGNTPIPCIECNRNLKFGALLNEAKALGCDRVITGHYANVEYDSNVDRYYLKRGADLSKDQTYVLYFLSQEQLSILDFPVGKYSKSHTREIAASIGLDVASKKDSEDICFVPDKDYAAYIESKEEEMKLNLPGPGNYIDREGNILGQHKGYYHYTVGQRKGLGIALGLRAFVTEIRPGTNEVVLGIDSELYTKNVHVNKCYIISDIMPDGSLIGEIGVPFRCSGKVRYGLKEMDCMATVNPDGSMDVVFDNEVRAAVKGQSLVIYRGDYCLGGGIIG